MGWLEPGRLSNWGLIGLLAIMSLAACGSDDDGTAADMECGGDDHPCSLAEVELERIERTLTLGSMASQAIAEGGTNSDVAEMLRSNDDVAEVSWDEEAIRFRVEGAREHWILLDSGFATRSAPGSVSHRLGVVEPPVLPHVVGEDRISKRALVLSPFSYEFSEDEGSDVAGILGSTRGYEGGINFLESDQASDTNIGVDIYKQLNVYDVVHIATHGATICEEDGCRGVIMPFNLEPWLPNLEGATPEEKLQAIEEQGMATWQTVDGNVGVELTADFFKAHYGGGLENTLIFFSACETFTGGSVDLIEAIRGESSVFFGWDAVVNSAGARARSIELYTDLSTGGYTAGEGFDRMSTHSDGKGAQLKMRGPADERDVRIRDVVELLDPLSGDLLGAGAPIEIVGETGDGDPDSVPFMVRVDGITSVQHASETRLHVSVDGEEIGPLPVSSGERNDDGQWTLTGEVELSYDVEDELEVSIEAWVELPSGGESRDTSSAILGGDVSPGEWELSIQYSHTPVTEPDGPGLPDTATATLTLTRSDLQIPDSNEVRYEVTGGSVTYDPTKRDRFCDVKGDPVTFAVTPEIAAGSRLVLDMSTDPIQFIAHIAVDGPRYEAEYACRAGTGEDAPPGYQDPETQTRSVFLVLLSLTEGPPGVLSADGSMASGTVVIDQTGVMPGSIVESSYTLTRKN